MKFFIASALLAAGHCPTAAAQQFTRTSQAGGGTASRVSRYTKRDVVKPIESTNATQAKLKRPPNPATTDLDVGVLSNNEDVVDTTVAKNTNLDTGILSKDGNTGRARPGRPTTKKPNERKSSVPVNAIKKRGSHNNIVKPRQEKRHFTGTNSNKPIAGGSYSPIDNIAKADNTCDEGYVLCYNGNEIDDNGEYTGVTCNDVCGTECCLGEDACDGFSGQVCKDGSCNGEKACYNAFILSVIDGCTGIGACYFAAYGSPYYIENIHGSCNGFRACDVAADYGGVIFEIVDSCQGDYACNYLANGEGSYVRKVQDSCIKDLSCYSAAVNGGSIDEIVNSCDGEYACAYAAFGRFNESSLAVYGGGSISKIENSCIQYKSCMYAAELGGSIGDISFSCNGVYSCFALTFNYGTVGGNIYDSCKQEDSCLNAATDSGYIGYIFSGCDGKRSCRRAAADGGTIDGIRLSCNNNDACDYAAYGGNIDGPINDCCNYVAGVCANVTDFNDLPEDCGSQPTMAPTSSPTRKEMPSSKSSKSKGSKSKSSKAKSSKNKEEDHAATAGDSEAENTTMPTSSPTTAKAAKESTADRKRVRAHASGAKSYYANILSTNESNERRLN